MYTFYLFCNNKISCVPNYSQATCGPCTGSCLNGTQWCTATNCSPQLYSRSTPCQDQLNCFCTFSDILQYINVDSGVVTCGDCSTMTQGQTCYLHCLRDNEILSGPSSVLCLSSGFAIPSQPIFCYTETAVCPPQVSIGAINYVISTSSVCVGATNSQVCSGNCFPGYYNAQGIYDSTCSCDNTGNCTWDVTLFCTSQTQCNNV